MIWLILLTIITYLKSLWSGFISDDITAHSVLKNQNYPIRLSDIKHTPNHLIHDLIWRLFKEKAYLHHLLSLIIFIGLVISFYIVGCKFLPQKVMFIASLIFAVHPCNAQVAGWISGKWYMVASILGLWALYFNNIIFYFISLLFACNTILLPLLMNISIPIKLISISLGLFILVRALQSKTDTNKTEGLYKKENIIIYPRKLIVALKSFVYYFCLALFPMKMGWFHEIGEPIDEKLKSFNRHFWLCAVLLGVMCLFFNHSAILGLLIFACFIAPFTNIITLGLFTSERYMTLAIMGFSLFLANLTVNYPILTAVIITMYFMRTQLELWAYRDDFTLALYSLFNFSNSGFAWTNVANYFLHSGRPSAAFDTLQEAIKRCPTFPTTYYQLYLMYRANNLLNDCSKALFYLEKACYYGKHENWFKELEDFRMKLKEQRIKRFKESYATRYPTIRQYRPGTQSSPQDIEPALVGVIT